MNYKTNSYRELKVWQKAMDFAVNVYEIIKRFPSEEKFGLTEQLNRSEVSIASNIAEGAGQESKKEFSQFLSIALGSSFESDTQLILAYRLHYISLEEVSLLASSSLEIQKMLFGLKKSLLKKSGFLSIFLFTF